MRGILPAFPRGQSASKDTTLANWRENTARKRANAQKCLMLPCVFLVGCASRHAPSGLGELTEDAEARMAKAHAKLRQRSAQLLRPVKAFENLRLV